MRFLLLAELNDDRALFSRDDTRSRRGISDRPEFQVLAVGAAGDHAGHCKEDDPMFHVPILRLARGRQNFCRTPVVTATTS